MARLALNKAALHRESGRLKAFERFLPSLDLKRRQLVAERARAVRILADTEKRIETIEQAVARDLPMLSNHRVDLAGLTTVADVSLDEENLLGARLPLLRGVEVKIRDYALLGRPHWVDAVARRLKETLALKVQAQVDKRRLELLDQAVQKITQRVNLFDKVLIPRTRQNIKRIRIHLADAERAGVVRAKLAKSRHVEESATPR